MALFKGTKEPTTSPDAGSDAPPATMGSMSTTAPAGESAAECMRVGQILAESGQLSADQLAAVLAAANGNLLALADSLATRHAIGRPELAEAISTATQVPVLDTRGLDIAADVKGVLDEVVVREHCVIAVREENGSLVVVTADPTPARRAAVEAAAGRPITFYVADPATVRTYIDSTYRADADVHRLVEAIEVGDDQARLASIAAEVALDDQAPVIQLVSRIVSQALRDRASDIHVEPLDDRLRIRFRIDGHLVETFDLPVGVHAALTSRLKIMSGMNIVEKRRPQDGQFSTTIDGKDVDVRVASVSTVFGEKIVMRILDKSRSMIGLSELGFPRETYLHYSKMIHSPFGMVICAGPTGAGKTTTLYASLLEVNSSGKNITTVEDPVEYVFPGINQIQTNDQAGLTFATG
ncbi:MAG: type secretion system protein, partial [Actinomycetota bacterium]